MHCNYLAYTALSLYLFLLPINSFQIPILKPSKKSCLTQMKMIEKYPTTIDTTEKEWLHTFELIKRSLFLPVSSDSIMILSNHIDTVHPNSRESQILKLSRQNMLTKLLETDREKYLEIVSELGDRISRPELPNRQEITISATINPSNKKSTKSTTTTKVDGVTATIADCKLQNQTFFDNMFDKLLLNIFRKFVQDEINFVSKQSGILGLLEEGRHFMLSPQGTPENQQRYVRSVLDRLLTPFLPPLYRIVMSGIVPCKENNDPVWLLQLTDIIRSTLPKSLRNEFIPGRQFGPMFYTPYLTSAMTASLIYFLVGPSSINRRKDGKYGGMIVEKCKFLQESGCKGE